MIYAVATHSFLVIVDLDPSWRVKNYQILSKGYHYGMAMIKDGAGNTTERDDKQLIVYRGGESISEQKFRRLMIYQITDSFELVDSIPLVGNVGDVHQITYANGGLYIANSEYNSILFLHHQNSMRHEYFFENVTYDRNHLNSVYPCGDQILVVLHNKGRKESQVAILKHDLAKGFSLERKLSLWHHACHNAFLDDDYLFYNASPVHSLVKVSLAGNSVTKKLSFEGHCKGLSVTKDYLVVGLSEDTFRDRRPFSKGKLAIIDRHSLSIISTVDLNFSTLPHPIGNINEVRCLSDEELAYARSARLNSNWSSLRLAEKHPMLHQLRRLQIKLLLPARRAKSYLRKNL